MPKSVPQTHMMYSNAHADVADSDSPCPRVEDIRRQWAIHEDEALAHRLQDEEITQHYAGNRTRNAIVREDGPRARDEQRKEEQDALEQRLRHLSLLQRQAEEDAQVAQELARKYQTSDFESVAHSSKPKNLVDLDDIINPICAVTKTDLSLLGASCLPSTSASIPRTPPKQETLDLYEADEDDLRLLQEQRDAELAQKVQDELEQLERDRLLAIEAQDRELARVLYEKEKARLRRAKERAKLKAEAAASSRHSNSEDTSPETCDYEKAHKRMVDANLNCPPRIPEKSSAHCDGPLGFKANPKRLPPQPQSASNRHRSEYDPMQSRSDDPVPPYMPILGFNRITSSPKRPPPH